MESLFKELINMRFKAILIIVMCLPLSFCTHKKEVKRGIQLSIDSIFAVASPSQTESLPYIGFKLHVKNETNDTVLVFTMADLNLGKTQTYFQISDDSKSDFDFRKKHFLPMELDTAFTQLYLTKRNVRDIILPPKGEQSIELIRDCYSLSTIKDSSEIVKYLSNQSIEYVNKSNLDSLKAKYPTFVIAKHLRAAKYKTN